MDEQELRRISARLEVEPAIEAVRWAQERFGSDLVVTASFQDCVLIDVVTGVDPGVRVVFVDTGSQFPETLEFMERVRERYRLNLTVLSPGPQAEDWPCGSEHCCTYRKVRPLQTVLADARAWMSGLRRNDAPARAATPIVAFDASRGVVKVNPLAAWSDADVLAYSTERNLPVHPLAAKGYRSIGCAPTTVAVLDGADARSGRWPGTAKTECGLHLALEIR